MAVRLKLRCAAARRVSGSARGLVTDWRILEATTLACDWGYVTFMSLIF